MPERRRMQTITRETVIRQTQEDYERRLWDCEKFHCEVCGGLCCLYPRPFVSEYCCILKWMQEYTDNTGEEWIEIVRLVEGHDNTTSGSWGDSSYMRHWGVVEQRFELIIVAGREERVLKKGWYRLRDRGRRFIRGELLIPRIAIIFKNALCDFACEDVSFRQATEVRFDYNELMNGRVVRNEFRPPRVSHEDILRSRRHMETLEFAP